VIATEGGSIIDVGSRNFIFARPTGSVTMSSLRPAVGPSR